LTRRAIPLYRVRLMTTRRSLIPLLALFVVGCGGGAAPAPVVATPAEAPSAPAAAAPAPDAAPKQVEAPAPDAAPKQVEAPTPAAAAPKASALQIEGVSISDVTGEQIAAALLKKLGGETQPMPPSHIGKYEQISIGGRKDKTNKVVVSVTISRWAKAPKPITDATDENDFAPKALQARYANTENVAQVYDPDGDVLVSVMYIKGGSSATAKTLLDALVKQPK
jgi:hypothetical protein